MANIKNNGDIVSFVKQKDYIMINNNIGRGSFGKTVLLKDPFINELFVAKKYEPNFKDIVLQERFYVKFLDEIKILYKLNHKNVVRIFGYYAYEDSHTGYIIMEYVDGQNIKEYIDKYSPFPGNASLDEIFMQLIDAFCYIEENGIVHRDIREGNILVDTQGVVKVIDFGIGKIFEQSKQSDDSLVSKINRGGLDTLPEEYYERKYTSQTDMFYLGELFNRLLKNTDNSVSLSFSYYDVIEKMVEKNPKNRFKNFQMIRNALMKRELTEINISDEDRRIYQDLTNEVWSSIILYLSEPRFNMDPTVFLSRLENAINNNLFETYIQNNAEVISCIVECGYRYKTGQIISTNSLKRFLKWFSKSSPQLQELILKNFVSKLSTIKVDELEPDVPF